MDIANLFVSPVIDLFKCSIPPLKRQIDYIIHCEKKFNKLKEKVEELERAKNDVQQKVMAARRNLESIHEVVEAWLVKVEKEASRDGDDQTILRLVMNGDAVNMINTKCWCSCGSGSRYDLGRKAEKKMFILDELLNEGKGFGDNVSSPCVMDINLMSSNNQDDVEPFASREHLKDEVMVALRDEGINLIGVYGMGGVGKTTLVTQVYEQVKKEKDLFDEVVMTTISQDLDLRKIQNELADMLGLKQMKEWDNPLARASLLSERLKQTNILVILDDLWSYLKFFDMGIPCGKNHQKVCKVIITTRRLEVCASLDSKKNVNVAELPEQEAWKLFKNNVGDLTYSPCLESTAKLIVKECKGLPVALVTLGRGLRGKESRVWDNTLHALRNSKTTCIEGMEPQVFSSIKLSYDYLREEILKKYFLLCCLFPEDHKIYIADLMAYVIGDDTMVEDEETLKQIQDRVCTVLDKLVDSCLLSRISNKENNYVVSMHDVIRDVAINIASHQEGNWFLVKAGVGLKHWPGKSLLTSSNGTSKWFRRLSLMKNEITVLPNEPPELRHLLSLSLYANNSLKVIPDSFFQTMGSLATLDLRETGISFLPSSLSSLVNLKTLYLDECKFNQPTDISVIGKLKKLEILSLAKCGLDGLPEEIRELTNLRWLDLRSNYCNDFIIPKNVISSLTRLEYLNMSGPEIKWEADGCWGNGNTDTLAEIASLPCLSGLILKSYNPVNKEKFRVSFYDAIDIMLPKKWDKPGCTVTVSPPVCHSIKMLIQRVESLELEQCTGLKSVGQLGDGFNNLKVLHVIDCDEMEYVMSFVAEADIPRPFVALKSLILHQLSGLKRIFDGPIPIGFIDRLSYLRVKNCPLDNIFDPNLGKRVPNLENLSVSCCHVLKDVFNFEEIGTSTTFNIEKARSSSDVTFSKLRDMYLDRLPIVNIWKGCIPIGCFANLEKIVVRKCYNLVYLFSTSMAGNLQKLKQLEILYCSNMVKLVTSDEQMVCDDEDNQQLPLKIFPNLKYLRLRDCGNLKQLWDGKIMGKEDNENAAEDDQLAIGRASILDFPCLEYLQVVWCEDLKRIYLTHRCTQQLKEIRGYGEGWFDEVLEWENPADKLNMQPLFKQDPDIGTHNQ